MGGGTQKYNKLAGKHILIIGGTSGIGFAVAEGSIESSARVTISSSNPTKIQNAIQRIKKEYPSAEISGFACDLLTPDLENNIKALFEKVGKVDHIVFTAGNALALNPLSSISYESIIQAGTVRFIAPLLVAKIGSKWLNEGPGSSIVLTTGSTAEKPASGWSVVTSYAAGLYGMTKALAVDLKPVRVNCVSPGPVDTEIWDVLDKAARKKVYAEFGKMQLTGHIARADDVAEAYLWLMRDSNVTGFVASSNGGVTLM